jgi:hypothetical protein
MVYNQVRRRSSAGTCHDEHSADLTTLYEGQPGPRLTKLGYWTTLVRCRLKLLRAQPC